MRPGVEITVVDEMRRHLGRGRFAGFDIPMLDGLRPIGAARPARSLILPNRHGLATPAESHYSPVTLTWSRSGCGDFLALKCHGLSAAFVGRLAVRQGFVTSDNGFEKPRAALEREETQAL